MTVIRLRCRFIGLIDGTYYVNAERAEAAVGEIRIVLGRFEMKKPFDSAGLGLAARKAAFDDVLMTDGEQTVSRKRAAICLARTPPTSRAWRAGLLNPIWLTSLRAGIATASREP